MVIQSRGACQAAPGRSSTVKRRAVPVEHDSGRSDARAGRLDVAAGPSDVAAGPSDVAAGPPDVGAGPPDVGAGPPLFERLYKPAVLRGVTVTLMWTLVQQHWNPPPPSPVESFACMRRMYSPGAVNVALVVTLPLSLSIFGFDGSIVTAAGPRNRLHLTAGGGGVNPGIGGIGLTFGPSSVTHASSASGLPTDVDS